jgi:hypothetical protein
VAVIVAV